MKRGWAKKTDANQQDIVDDLRKLGCTVVDLSSVGQGCPDLLVGIRGFTILMEVKNEHGRNKLTPQQERWIERWKGSPVHVVRSTEQAVSAVNSYGT